MARQVRRVEGRMEAYVHFVDYGSVSWCRVEKLRRKLFMEETPVQCLKVRLAGLRQQWEQKTLELLHSCLVDQQLKLGVTLPGNSLPLVARVFLGPVDIGKMLVSNGLAKNSSHDE